MAHLPAEELLAKSSQEGKRQYHFLGEYVREMYGLRSKNLPWLPAKGIKEHLWLLHVLNPLPGKLDFEGLLELRGRLDEYLRQPNKARRDARLFLAEHLEDEELKRNADSGELTPGLVAKLEKDWGPRK